MNYTHNCKNISCTYTYTFLRKKYKGFIGFLVLSYNMSSTMFHCFIWKWNHYTQCTLKMLFVVVIVSKCTKIFPSSNFVSQIFIKIWKKKLKRNLLSQHSHFFPKPFAKFWEINFKKNVFGHILIVLLIL